MTVSTVPFPSGEAYALLEDHLPAAMFEWKLWGVLLWQWSGMAVLLVVAALLASVVAAAIGKSLRPIVKRTATDLDNRLLKALLRPVRFLLLLAFFALGLSFLRLPADVLATVTGIEKAFAVIGAAWLALRVVDLLAAAFSEHLERQGHRTATAVVPLCRRAAKVALVALALIAALQNVGYNATGLIAGLGVGGLAVALAAQKSIANLFGGVSLIADRPVLVGDVCRFGDGKMGTVEEIGLRSTRVRTPDRTLITVPNAEFSEIQLENFGARDRIRLQTTLNLRYETSPDQLRWLLAELRKLLVAHPRLADEPARARFVALGAHSLDVEVLAYVATRDWNEFLQVREDVLLRMMDLVHAAGTDFAFPSQTLYMGRDAGLDPERAKEAEGRVATWRSDGNLPFPDLPNETVASLRDTLPYPPPGSAGASAS